LATLTSIPGAMSGVLIFLLSRIPRYAKTEYFSSSGKQCAAVRTVFLSIRVPFGDKVIDNSKELQFLKY